MRPHHVSDTIRSLSGIAKTPEELRKFQFVAALFAKTNIPTFDFGVLAPKQEHVDFGKEMFERGVFRLPFDQTFFSFTAPIPLGVLAVQQDNGLCCIPCRSTAIPGAKPQMIPMFIIYLGLDESGHTYWQGEPVIDELEHDYEPLVSQALHSVVGAVTMLMSKDVSTDIKEPSRIMLRERKRKGKSPIGATHFVKLTPEAERDYRDHQGGTHASPVIHFRRGHFRRLPGDRVVPVAPCIVGANDQSKAAFPKDYVVGEQPVDA